MPEDNSKIQNTDGLSLPEDQLLQIDNEANIEALEEYFTLKLEGIKGHTTGDGSYIPDNNVVVKIRKAADGSKTNMEFSILVTPKHPPQGNKKVPHLQNLFVISKAEMARFVVGSDFDLTKTGVFKSKHVHLQFIKPLQNIINLVLASPDKSTFEDLSRSIKEEMIREAIEAVKVEKNKPVAETTVLNKPAGHEPVPSNDNDLKKEAIQKPVEYFKPKQEILEPEEYKRNFRALEAYLQPELENEFLDDDQIPLYEVSIESKGPDKKKYIEVTVSSKDGSPLSEKDSKEISRGVLVYFKSEFYPENGKAFKLDLGRTPDKDCVSFIISDSPKDINEYLGIKPSPVQKPDVPQIIIPQEIIPAPVPTDNVISPPSPPAEIPKTVEPETYGGKRGAKAIKKYITHLYSSISNNDFDISIGRNPQEYGYPAQMLIIGDPDKIIKELTPILDKHLIYYDKPEYFDIEHKNNMVKAVQVRLVMDVYLCHKMSQENDFRSVQEADLKRPDNIAGEILRHSNRPVEININEHKKKLSQYIEKNKEQLIKVGLIEKPADTPSPPEHQLTVKKTIPPVLIEEITTPDKPVTSDNIDPLKQPEVKIPEVAKTNPVSTPLQEKEDLSFGGVSTELSLDTANAKIYEMKLRTVLSESISAAEQISYKNDNDELDKIKRKFNDTIFQLYLEIKNNSNIPSGFRSFKERESIDNPLRRISYIPIMKSITKDTQLIIDSTLFFGSTHKHIYKYKEPDELVKDLNNDLINTKDFFFQISCQNLKSPSLFYEVEFKEKYPEFKDTKEHTLYSYYSGASGAPQIWIDAISDHIKLGQDKKTEGSEKTESTAKAMLSSKILVQISLPALIKNITLEDVYNKIDKYSEEFVNNLKDKNHDNLKDIYFTIRDYKKTSLVKMEAYIKEELGKFEEGSHLLKKNDTKNILYDIANKRFFSSDIIPGIVAQFAGLDKDYTEKLKKFSTASIKGFNDNAFKLLEEGKITLLNAFESIKLTVHAGINEFRKNGLSHNSVYSYLRTHGYIKENKIDGVSASLEIPDEKKPAFKEICLEAKRKYIEIHGEEPTPVRSSSVRGSRSRHNTGPTLDAVIRSSGRMTRGEIEKTKVKAAQDVKNVDINLIENALTNIIKRVLKHSVLSVSFEGKKKSEDIAEFSVKITCIGMGTADDIERVCKNILGQFTEDFPNMAKPELSSNSASKIKRTEKQYEVSAKFDLNIHKAIVMESRYPEDYIKARMLPRRNNDNNEGQAMIR